MAETRKLKTSKAATSSAQTATTEIVVRRGALRRFDQLKSKAAGLPVIVSGDRRQVARREESSSTAQERRKADRRQAPPFTWEMAEFVVVAPRPQVPGDAPAKPKARKAAAARSRR